MSESSGHMALPAPVTLRSSSFLLSAYLCGTHSGLLAPRRAKRRFKALADATQPEAVARFVDHARLSHSFARTVIEPRPWEPNAETRALQRGLLSALNRSDVVDLVLFGSQARGTTTGFSDVDAILVIDDSAARDPGRLRALRRSVLAAQRAVLGYQPMQHHGFEVVTESMLPCIEEVLELPAVALRGAQSLRAERRVLLPLTDAAPVVEIARARLAEAVAALAPRPWPAHAWEVHRVISMFELLPALYLQARGAPVAKSSSFAAAAGDFGGAWSPFDTLREVRAAWPRRTHPTLVAIAAFLRNPWAAVAVWRRLRVPVPAIVRPLLTVGLRRDLSSLAREMLVKAA